MPGPVDDTHVAVTGAAVIAPSAPGAAPIDATRSESASAMRIRLQLSPQGGVMSRHTHERVHTPAVITPAYRLIFRLEIANRPGMFATVATTIGKRGCSLGAIDLVEA